MKSAPAVERAIALVFTVGPGAFRVADGVEQSATFGSHPVGALLLNMDKECPFQLRNLSGAKTGGCGNR